MLCDLLNIYDAETFFVVAPVTGRTELPLVNIVPAVTINTQPVLVTGLLPGPAMAGMAMNISVCMAELERGFVVIEIPDQPGIGVMA